MAISQSPVKLNAEKIFKKAMLAYNANNKQQAEKLFRKILRKNTMHLDANFMLGNLYAINGNLKDALKYLKQAAIIKPDSIQVINNLANVLRLLGKNEEALSQYARVLQMNPGFTAAIQNIAFCNFKLKRYDEAIKYFMQHLQTQPNDADSLLALGEIYLETNETSKAIETLRACKESGSKDISQIELLLAKLGDSPLPDCYPLDMTISTYKDKARNWDNDAMRPDHHYQGPQLVETALNQHLSVNSNLTILDLGCGTGGCAPFLKPLSKRLIGVDVSPDMLAVAKEKNIYDELIKSDMYSFLNTTTESFDLITAAGVFILIGYLDTYFHQVERVLSPGGLFVLTLYKGDKGVTLRHNLHFAHSRNYVLETAEKTGMLIEMLEEVIHETDNNIPQEGFIVVLKKPS